MNNGRPIAAPLTAAGILSRLTGAAILAAGAMLYGNGGATLSTLTVGAANTVLTSSGSAPQWSTSIAPTGTVASKQAAAAGISLDHNSATGNFTLRLSPANLTASRRWTFADRDDTAAGLAAQTFSGIQTFGSGTASTSTSTGAVVVSGSGGVGIGGALNVGSTGAFAGAVTIDLGSGALPTALSNTTLRQANANGAGIRQECFAFGNSVTSVACTITGRLYGGTRSSPSATAIGDAFFQLTAFGSETGSASVRGGAYVISVDGTWSVTNHGVFHWWEGCTGGSTTNQEWMRLQSGCLTLSGGGILIPTAGNGLLQFAAGTTKAYGISLNNGAMSLFSNASNSVIIQSTTTSAQYAVYESTGTYAIQAFISSSNGILGTTGSTPLLIRTNSLTAITISTAQVVTVNASTSSTSTTTGSLVNSGGFGNAGEAFIGKSLTVGQSNTVDGQLTVQFQAANSSSPLFNGAGFKYLANGAAGFIGFTFQRSNGNTGAAGALVNNDVIMQLTGQGDYGSLGLFGNGAAIQMRASGTWTSSTNCPSSILFQTNNGSALTTALTIDQNQLATFAGGITVGDAKNITVGSTNGTQIATANTQKLGFWGATAIVRPSGAAQAAVATTAATNTTPYGYTTAAQADGVITLLNEIRNVLVNTGLMKGSA